MLVSHHINFWYGIYCSQGEGPTSQTWTKSSVGRERSTLPRRRTGFNAGALIPGSVSTMVSLPESDDDQTVTTLASPSFQSILDGDTCTSSEYETDLEEDFPGKSECMDIYFVVSSFSNPKTKNRTDLAGVSFNLFSRKAIGFCRYSKLFELNFFVRNKVSTRWLNQAG